MINILCWNIRGVRSRGTMSHLLYLLNNNRIDILVLLEPLVDCTNLEQITKDLKFDHSIHGGSINSKIWVMWREDILVNQIQWHEQHITCHVLKNDSQTMCSFIYAKCRRYQRMILWDDLISIANNISVPWLVGGDFNVITMNKEKKGTHPPDINAIMDFNNFIMRAGLSDTGYVGHDFTWCNNRSGDDKVWERLDRFLVNGPFISAFSNPKVTHLPMASSDHCPLLVQSINDNRFKSRFHFNRMWITHPSFRDVVESSWNGHIHDNPLINFGLKLKRLRSVLKRWNWEVFGDQKRKEDMLFLEINHLEGLLQSNHNDQLERDLKTKKSELENVLHLNECMARDKARVSWLKDGNRNTAFFHATVKARRSRNTMLLIQSDGSSTSNPKDIGCAAVDYFSNLFNGYTPPPTTEDLQIITRSITESTADRLTTLPSEEEVHDIITNMNQDSSPGADGFSVPFYVQFWNLIKLDLMESVHAFFQGQHLPSFWTATIITLIPKSSNASNISEMRPISLCNVSHKIISRILNTRLRDLLPNFISEEQSGFVKNRHIHSNLALAHDMTSDLHKKSRDGNIIIKLDMSKAYDRISWSYLIRVMRKFGFNEKWCDLIFRCISNGRYSIQWHGQLYGYFTASRGVRQGDPLSSSLFALVMEWFSKTINSNVHSGMLKSYGNNSGVLRVSHLLYADDILIFTKGCDSNVRNLMNILIKFCDVTGQRINQAKSGIFFSKHIPDAHKEMILNITQFQESQLPAIYLGAPLFQGRIKSIYFDELVSKLNRKIRGWMRNYLSFAGRVTLVQSVLSSMGLHAMTVLPVPKTVLHKIESLIANFLWDQGPQKRFHWIRYDLICRPKKSGGLGIRKLEDIMLALHAKLAWEFIHQHSLWARYVKSRFTTGSRGSAIWNAIQHLVTHLRTETIWDMGNGSLDVKSWCTLYDAKCPSNIDGLTTRAVFDSSNEAIKRVLIDAVPCNIRHHYSNIRWGSHPGRIRWLGNTSGEFTVKDFLCTYKTQHPTLDWAIFVWKNWFPNNISIFIWKFFMDRLSTDDNIRRIGIPITSQCHCCGTHEETSDHLFFKGIWATEMWRFLANIFDCARPLSRTAINKYWIRPSLNGGFSEILKASLACHGLSEIWKARNESRHDKAPHRIILSITKRAKDIIHLMPISNIRPNDSLSRIFFLLDVPAHRRVSLRGSWDCWNPGTRGICLNIAARDTDGYIKGAGLFRSHQGEFIFASIQTITKSRSDTELLQILDHCLEIARIRNFQIAMIQSSHPDILEWKFKNRINSVRRHIRCQQILPMLNHAAGSLLYSTQTDLTFVRAEDLPLHVIQCLKKDALQIPYFCTSHENQSVSNYGKILDDIIHRKKRYETFRDDLHFV